MSLLTFLLGILTMGSLTCGLFLLRFYSQTGDRLFLIFAVAFGVLAAHWAVLVLLPLEGENRPLAYILRLVAFGFILLAIIDKNRRAS